MDSLFKKLAVCVFYGVSSSSLSFINKSLFLVHGFRYPNMLLLIQFLYGVCFTVVFKMMKPGGIPKIWKVPNFSRENVVNCLPLAVTFLLNVMAGITALSKVNIPVFLAFRRLCTSFIFIGDVFVLQKPPKALETIGVAMITIGAVMAGMNDLKADFVGYALIFINNIVTTIHFNNIKKLSEKHPEIDSATSSFYMSTLSIPVLIFLVYFGESEAFDLFNRSSAFYFLLFISLNTGITLTFSQNWCTVVNSPIVTSITGNVKDVGLTAISMFLFDDIIVNTWLVLGIILSLAGAFTYSIPKIQEDTAKKD